MEQEIWEPVYGFNYKYSVSNIGRVRSNYYITKLGKEKPLNTFLRFTKNRNGYYTVKLTRILNGKKISKTCKVHRLVAIAFIPNTDNKPQVNHIDLNKLNNCSFNLEWATPKENTNHAQQNGARPIRSKFYIKKGYNKKGNPKYIIDLNTGIFWFSNELAHMYNTTPKEICRMISEERKPNISQYRYV